MSTLIKLKHLSDIINVKWNIEEGGRIKRNDGTYRSTDVYPRYTYETGDSPLKFQGRSLQWIRFNMISPRTIKHPDKIGEIQITCAFIGNSSYETWYCKDYNLLSWLETNITSGLYWGKIENVEIPLERQIIQNENRHGFCEKYNIKLSSNNKDEDNDGREFYNKEKEAYYNYSHYSREDMIQDALEGDESNYWNID